MLPYGFPFVAGFCNYAFCLFFGICLNDKDRRLKYRGGAFCTQQCDCLTYCFFVKIQAVNSHSLFCSLFLFPRLRAVTSFLSRLLFAVVFLSVSCQNGAFWLCRLVAVWRVLFCEFKFLCILFFVNYTRSGAVTSFLRRLLFAVVFLVSVGRSSKRCILALQACYRVACFVLRV